MCTRLRAPSFTSRYRVSLYVPQVHALVRLFLNEAAEAPARGGALQARPAPRLTPLAEEAEAVEEVEGTKEVEEVEEVEEAEDDQGGKGRRVSREEAREAREAREAGEASETQEAEEVKEAEEAHRMQLQAPQGARAIAVQAGAAEAAAVWRCTPCGCDACFCEPCPGCGASQPAHAMQAAIAAVRPLLDAAPDGRGTVNPFYRGVLDNYAVARSGVLEEYPATFRLVEPGQLPALPAPLMSDAVLEMRRRLGA